VSPERPRRGRCQAWRASLGCDEGEQRGHWCHERRAGSSRLTAAARRSPSRSGAAPRSGCAATPSSTSLAATRGLRSASTGSSATSTLTPNRRCRLPAGRPRTGRRRVRITWSGCATPRRTCVACATSATRSGGGLRSTPTRASATSYRCSRRGSSSARPRRPSRSLPGPTFVERRGRCRPVAMRLADGHAVCGGCRQRQLPQLACAGCGRVGRHQLHTPDGAPQCAGVERHPRWG
jgi:hypothetical protein